MEIKEYIREFNFWDIVQSRQPKVVVLGGGTGLSVILRGLKKYTNELTAVVSVGDDGGSSGILRSDLGMIPPGDIRNCITALADDESIMQDLFNYRFSEGELSGHSFGNLFLAAMDGISFDFYDAVRRTSDVLQITGRVLPVSLEEMVLIATLENGLVVEGESTIPQVSKRTGAPIHHMRLKNEVRALPETIDAILEAEIIILGPGSLFTSLLPHLLVEGVEEAIKKSRAKKFYIANIMSQPGETHGMTQNDAVTILERHQQLEGHLFQYILVNESEFERQVIETYGKTSSKPMEIGEKKPGYDYVVRDFSSADLSRVRHNADSLAQTIFQIALENPKHKLT